MRQGSKVANLSSAVIAWVTFSVSLQTEQQVRTHSTIGSGSRQGRGWGDVRPATNSGAWRNFPFVLNGDHGRDRAAAWPWLVLTHRHRELLGFRPAPTHINFQHQESTTPGTRPSGCCFPGFVLSCGQTGRPLGICQRIVVATTP
jgi:hypothetical protein